MATRRPSFQSPPLVEVVCGIHFRQMTSFEAPHYGLFWEVIRRDFPRTRTVPTLGSPFPRGIQVTLSPNEQAEINVPMLVNAPDMPRVWFISEDDTSLVQLQPDRFLFNWREGAGGAPYPRYTTVIRRFKSLFRTFEKFLADNGLGQPAFQQTEMAYINHIERGAGWESFADLGKVFPDICWRRGKRFVGRPDSFVFRTSHPMPGGTLQVIIQSARTKQDPVNPLIRFDLNASASVEGGRFTDVTKWYDTANKWIVDAFIDLTSEDMQKNVWRRVA